jgi:hypothetical protein
MISGIFKDSNGLIEKGMIPVRLGFADKVENLASLSVCDGTAKVIINIVVSVIVFILVFFYGLEVFRDLTSAQGESVSPVVLADGRAPAQDAGDVEVRGNSAENHAKPEVRAEDAVLDVAEEEVDEKFHKACFLYLGICVGFFLVYYLMKEFSTRSF